MSSRVSSALWGRRVFRLIAFGTATVLYGNVIALGTGSAGIEGAVAELGPLLALAGALAWAHWGEGLSLSDLGVTRKNLRASLAWGLAAGLAMGIPPIIFFSYPLISAQPVQYVGYASLDAQSLLLYLLLRLPIRTALVEEIVFRGVIQTQGIRALGAPRGIGLCCLFFVLWHVVITYRTLPQTNLVSSSIPLAALWLSAAAPLAAAGVIFSLVRHRTNSVAGPFLAHWLVNGSMLLFLYVQPRLG